MKTALGAVILCLAMGSPSQQQKPEDDLGLPELHKIKTATLSPSYSCRSKEDFNKGYEKTALFLSSYSQHRNAPDLLFNGACGSQDYFVGGGDMPVIADLGNIPLEKVTALLAFNTKNVHSFDLYSKFAREVEVKANHTYAVLINSSELRGLFLFTVVDYVQNKKVDLRYAVKKYQLLNVRAESEGFDWEAKNQTDSAQK